MNRSIYLAGVVIMCITGIGFAIFGYHILNSYMLIPWMLWIFVPIWLFERREEKVNRPKSSSYDVAYNSVYEFINKRHK